MTTDPYVPIDCDRHSELEVLAMRRARVLLRAAGEGGVDLTLDARVHDVSTRGGAEYLVVHDRTGREQAIRLDRLLALYDAAGGAVWRRG